jgi:hypothetical protein
MKIWFCYGVTLVSLALSEALLAPTLSLNADHTSHFKWASDLLAGNPIFWSGVDANRIFPDLLFSLIAATLPAGQSYDVWVIYFCGVLGLSLGLSLLLLSRALYSESSERILFFAVSCATFIAVITTLSFWVGNIMAPGFHGGSFPMVTAVTALFLMNVKAERMNYLFLFAFALICTFLVMSNRYLVACLMVPLLIAALVATQDRRRQIVLFSATLLSTAAGLELLHLLNSSIFFRLVAPHAHPSFHHFLSLSWWEDRIPKELRFLAGAQQRNQIILGLTIMSSAMIWGVPFPFQKSGKNSTLSLHRIFRLIVTISIICAVLFVVVMVDEPGDWRYRYFAIPLCLAVIALSTITVHPFGFKRRASLVAVCLPALSLMMASACLSFDISNRTYEVQFRADLRLLSDLLANHDGKTVHHGFATYWIANEVSVRSADIRVLTVDLRVMTPQDAKYHFFNNNAWELCTKQDFTFILVREETDGEMFGMGLTPERNNENAIVDQIGPPSSRQRTQLGRFGFVQILFYGPELLDKIIVQPGRAVARIKFPSFQCPKE